MADRHFALPDQHGVVIFKENVLEHMYQYIQKKWSQREAGGQLFSSSPHHWQVVIECITGPYPQDKRARHGFVPDLERATDDAIQNFDKGLHVVGQWHTHPEANPTPSRQDECAAAENLLSHSEGMTGYLLATLGNAGNPPNLSVFLKRKGVGLHWIALPEITAISKIRML